jgi:hypothetical protein
VVLSDVAVQESTLSLCCSLSVHSWQLVVGVVRSLVEADDTRIQVLPRCSRLAEVIIDRAESYSRVSINASDCNAPALSVWKGIPEKNRQKSVLSI